MQKFAIIATTHHKFFEHVMDPFRQSAMGEVSEIEPRLPSMLKNLYWQRALLGQGTRCLKSFKMTARDRCSVWQ